MSPTDRWGIADDFVSRLSDEQRRTWWDLVCEWPDLRFQFRLLPEFDGQLYTPLELRFSDGRWYVIAADGTVTDYGRAAG